MVDIFAKEGIEPPKDIFAAEGIAPPSIQERNTNAMTPPLLISQPPEVQAEVENHASQYEALARVRFTEEQIAEMKAKGPIRFSEAKDFLDAQDVLPGGGVYQAFDTAVIYNAAKKIERGEETTVNEDETLDKFINKQIEMNLRGLSVGGGIAYYGSQMPAFMVEFIATAGVGKAAQKGVQEGVEKVVQKAVVSKAAGTAANVLARTAAMPSMYLPNYAERRLNDYMALTDKGEMVFKESTESPAKSALLAYGHTSVEVASELSGAAIGKYVVGPVTGTAARYLKTPMTQAVSKIPVNVRQGLYQAYKAINPNASVSKVFTAAGWNGMLEELGEERIADVLHATLSLGTEKNYTMQDYLDAITPSSDQLLIEAGIIGIAGGVKTSADIGFNLLLQKTGDPVKARETIDNMSATEQEAFVNSQLGVKPGEPLPQQSAEAVAQAQGNAALAKDPPQVSDEESGFNRFYREFVNRLQPIEDLTREAEARGAEIAPGENPFTLSRTYAGVIGTIEHNLRYGTTRLNPETGAMEVTGKSLKAIQDDFDNTVAHIEVSRDQRAQDFNDYLIAQRVLADLSAREDVKVSEKDKAAAAETMHKLASKYGAEFSWFQTFGQETYEYQQRVLQNLVDAGNMSQETYDEILKKNPHYIPFQRVLDEAEKAFGVSTKGIFTNANKNRVIKKIKGSDKAIKNTTESIIANTARILELAHRNRVALAVADLADLMPEYVQREATPMKKITVENPEGGDPIETFRPSEIAPQGTVTVFRDGKKEYYKVSPALLEAMENLSPMQMNATMRLLTSPFRASARLLRAGATLIPEFWIRNVIRDQGTALLQSPIRPTPIDMVKGLSAVIGKTELYQDWLRNGGSFNSYMELDDKGLQKAYRELLKPQGKLARYSRNPINILADISGALEQGTRVGVYAKAQRLGVEGLEAALMSREATLDFARGGVVAKNINQYIPFFNAGVQSVDKLLRTFKENPKATMFWGMATITVPSLILSGYYLYGAPEDERREYLEIPQWQKDLFWVFKDPSGQWRRVPKPFSFGYLFGSIPERFMTWGYQGNKPEMQNFWLDFVMGVGGTLSPVYDPSALLPPLVKTTIEDITNYNFFTGRNIYPAWMDRLEPEKRANKYTSETARAIGGLLGVSPAVVDNTLRGQLAGSAEYATNASDFILNSVKKWNGETLPEQPLTQADIAVVKAFTVREPVGYGSNSVSNFFDSWERVSQVHATMGSLDGEEKQEYIAANSAALAAYKPMKNYYDRIRTLGKLSDSTYADKSMKSGEKVKALSEYGRQMVDIAVEANGWFKENVK